jgi:LIM domain kinase 1
VHRFTLLKPGAKQKRNSSGSASPNNHGNGSESAGGAGVGWNPLEILFSSGILVGKCDLCNKRIGWKPVLECDDCGLRFISLCLLSTV